MAEKRMTLERLYKDYASDGKNQKKAANVLNQIDWLTCNVAFDPISGTPTPLSLSEFVSRVACRDLASPDYPHDRLWHLVDHCEESVKRIIRNLNENPARDHEVMHLRRVREMDASSFVKLSMRPGRNIREKLSSNPYLQAVKRYMSVDLAENRLFKAFVRRLSELLELRWEMQKAVKGSSAEMHPLLDEIVRWLRSDVAAAISDWENTPPNNTLLSHRDYKKVWDAWRWMQTLDADVDRDCALGNANECKRREDLVRFWDEYVLVWKKSNDVKLVEVPLFFDYDTFEIHTWGDRLCLPLLADRIRLIQIGDVREASKIACSILAGEVRRSKEIAEPACVDLMQLSPCYAIYDKVRTLLIRLAWQNWQASANDGGVPRVESGAEKNVSFGLSGADAIWRHPDATTVAFADLFGGSDCKISEELQLRVAHACAEELKKIFIGETLVWLMPDGISEFELKAVRGSLNAAFENACPLPRSIAAIYEKVDFLKLPRERIQKRGYGILVLDTTAAGVLATNMTARYSAELEKKVPATLGYYWERKPSVLLTDEIARPSALVEFDAIDENGNVRPKDKRKNKWHQFRFEELRQRKDLGDFGNVVNLTNSPVVGGLKVYQLQQMAGKIPLWYDQLPELSTRIPVNGIYSRFYFVEKRNARISPRRGVAKLIPIEQEFTLPPGRNQYVFPLYMGTGDKVSRFVAVLRSTAFPLKAAVRCSLKMTYSYGDSQPYNLIFIPLEAGMKPMAVVWEIKKSCAANLSKLPVPDFMDNGSWASFAAGDMLKRIADQFDEIHACISGARNADLVAKEKQKLALEIESVDDLVVRLSGPLLSGQVKLRSLKKDRRDTLYCFVDCGLSEDVFCHSSNWADDITPESLASNAQVWVYCKRDPNTGKVSALWMNSKPEKPKFLEERISAARHRRENLKNRLDNFDRQIAATRKGRAGISEASVQMLVVRALASVLSSEFQRQVLSVWHNARSYRDKAAPEWFRLRMETVLGQLDADLGNETVSMEIKSRLVQTLSLLHKDMPPSAVAIVKRDIMFKGMRASSVRYVGYALGDVSMGWQCALLEWALRQIEKGAFPILREFSIAFWRYGSLIFKLRKGDCCVLCSALEKSAKKLICEIKSGDLSMLEKTTASSRYNFEVMLSLIRMRRGMDAEIARLFVPGSELSEELLNMVDSFTKVLVEHHLKLPSRISLNVNKPENLNGIPDLLYALRLFLSGDDGASTITISEVKDDDVANDVGEKDSVATVRFYDRLTLSS